MRRLRADRALRAEGGGREWSVRRRVADDRRNISPERAGEEERDALLWLASHLILPTMRMKVEENFHGHSTL